MHIEDDRIYFLTGRGKNVYSEVMNHPKVSYLSLKDNKSIRISGEAHKLDDQKYWIDLIFENNPFMNNVYPGNARYILEPLLKNVPYRLLSPWIPYTTNEEVVEKSNSKGCACLYALREDKIVLNKEWWEYIRVRYSKICDSTEHSFIVYLRSKNDHKKVAKFMEKGWSLV